MTDRPAPARPSGTQHRPAGRTPRRPAAPRWLAVWGCCALAVAALGAGGGHDAEKPDPIEANGPIFVDWPKPQVALVFTGEQEGYIEPCGCAGLTNQKGGLKRRHTFFKQMRKDGWPLLALDAGGQEKRRGPQAQVKFQRSLDALIELGYQAVGLGTNDLRLPLAGTIINLDEEKNPITSANVGLFEFDDLFTKRYRVVEAGGMRFGVTSVVTAEELQKLGQVADVNTMGAEEALREITPQLEKERCDHLILMVYGVATEAERLSKAFPQYRWVVAGRGGDEPPYRSRAIEGSGAQLIEVGHKGMYAVVVGLYGDEKPGFRYQKVPLDHRFEDSPAMQQLMVDYQDELRAMGFEGLGVKPLIHPAKRRFAGSEACADCHSQATEVFLKTPHSHATDTIVELDPPRHFDPECLSCHVTGWDPQRFLPFGSGYAGLEATPHLKGQGCENCHGPGADHVDAELGNVEADEAQLEALRAELRMSIVENEGNQDGQVTGAVVDKCLECHDLDNSPDFDFQKYWPQVAHEGKE